MKVVGIKARLGLVEVHESAGEGTDWTGIKVATEVVANDLPTNAVLLVCKCEGGESGAFDVRNGAGEDSEAASANPHLNVLETKQ